MNPISGVVQSVVQTMSTKQETYQVIKFGHMIGDFMRHKKSIAETDAGLKTC